MINIIASGLPQLKPFRLDLRDKGAIRALLFKLDIPLLGWNLPHLCEEHFFEIPYEASLDNHRNGLCVLIAILVSSDGEHLLNNDDARFDPECISKERFLTFVTRFVDCLKDSLIDGSAQRKTALGVLVLSRGIFDIMEQHLYSGIFPRNPAVPAATAFMLILLADLYPLSIHEKTGAAVADRLWARVLQRGRLSHQTGPHNA